MIECTKHEVAPKMSNNYKRRHFRLSLSVIPFLRPPSFLLCLSSIARIMTRLFLWSLFFWITIINSNCTTSSSILSNFLSATILFSNALAATTTTATPSGAPASGTGVGVDSYQINVTVCSNVYYASYQCHLDFAMRNFPNFKSQFWPNINVVGVPLAFTSPFVDESDIQTTIGAVRAWIKNDGDSKCDLFIGPSISDTAIAMSPLLERPLWVDYGASSTQLSNKGTYPSFLRAIPSDEQGAPKVAELLKFFNWKSVFLVKADNSYVTTWTTAVIAAHNANGGQVVRTYNTISSTITEEQLTSIMLEIRAAETESRIVIVVGVDYNLMNIVFQKHQLHDNLIVVFSEEPCSNAAIDWGKVNGAFCLTTGFEGDRYDQYMAAFQNRSEAEFNKSITPLLELGYPYGYLSRIKDDNDVYGAISVDSVWYGLTVLQEYQAANGRSLSNIDSTTLARFAMEHNITFPYGLTGSISVNRNGDRSNFVASLYNSLSDNSTRVVGSVNTDGNLEQSGGGGSRARARQRLYILGQYYDITGLSRQQIISMLPADRAFVPFSEKNGQIPGYVWAITGVLAFVISCLVIGGVLSFLYGKFKKGWRTRHAPKNEAEPAAIIFTDIESSTALWAECPQQMVTALELHNTIVRRCITTHRGYEVKTIGDSFMVAFKSALDAVNFSLAVQKDLFEADWSDNGDGGREGKINFFYEEQHATDEVESPLSVWNGLRVRVGGHHGFVSIRRTVANVEGGKQPTDVDESVPYDYFGSTVNVAARVESIGHGGQVLLTKALMDAYDKDRELDPIVTVESIRKPHGAVNLRGYNEAVQITQIIPMELQKRFFGPLRIERAENEMNLELEQASGHDTVSVNKSVILNTGRSKVSNSNQSTATIDVAATIANYCSRRKVREEDMKFGFIAVDALTSVMSQQDQKKFLSLVLKAWRISESGSDAAGKKAIADVIMWQKLTLAGRLGPVAAVRETKLFGGFPKRLGADLANGYAYNKSMRSQRSVDRGEVASDAEESTPRVFPYETKNVELLP